MKQSSNTKPISLLPIATKIQKPTIQPVPASTANPEIEVNKSSSLTHYYNPAVHLKKNFLKFTKTATSISQEESRDMEASRQQQVLKSQQSSQMFFNNANESLKFFKEENRILQQKVSFLENQCLNKQKYINEKDMQLSQLAKGMEQWQRKIKIYQQNEGKLAALMNYYQSLSFNCQNCKQIAQKYKNMSLRYEQICEKCNQLEKILQNKDFLMQSHIKAKNDQLKSGLASKNNEIKSLDLRISILEKENQRLYEQLTKASTVKEDQRTSKFQKMGQEFELKMEQAINQNIKLRNFINNLQGKIEQLRSKNTSLQNILKAYQDSEQLNSGSKTRSQLDLLRSQLEKVKQEYDNMTSKYEYQILRLQNQISQQRLNKSESLLPFSDSQRLREALMNAIWQIQSLKANQKGTK